MNGAARPSPPTARGSTIRSRCSREPTLQDAGELAGASADSCLVQDFGPSGEAEKAEAYNLSSADWDVSGTCAA